MPFSEQVKIEVRRKAHHRCCICNVWDIEVHHIIPQSDSGPDDIENAAPLCGACHNQYGGNPEKRKAIIETRDTWYDICAKREESFPEKPALPASSLPPKYVQRKMFDTLLELAELFGLAYRNLRTLILTPTGADTLLFNPTWKAHRDLSTFIMEKAFLLKHPVLAAAKEYDAIGNKCLTRCEDARSSLRAIGGMASQITRNSIEKKKRELLPLWVISQEKLTSALQQAVGI